MKTLEQLGWCEDKRDGFIDYSMKFDKTYCMYKSINFKYKNEKWFVSFSYYVGREFNLDVELLTAVLNKLKELNESIDTNHKE
jgi:hypothetical protein